MAGLAATDGGGDSQEYMSGVADILTGEDVGWPEPWSVTVRGETGPLAPHVRVWTRRPVGCRLRVSISVIGTAMA